jgi:hypothetical protein
VGNGAKYPHREVDRVVSDFVPRLGHSGTLL